MSRSIRGLLGLSLLFVARGLNAQEPPDQWATAMKQFEALDRQTPPIPGGIVFVGSSSIRLWNLDESFPDWETVNRGFGGSQLADSVRHVDLLVLRHKPRAVVMYAGDNDINAGKSPAEVADDFRAFEKAVHAALPETEIFYIAIKPSLARWKLAKAMQSANERIAAICQEQSACEFINIWDPMLGEDGHPRPELLMKDGLHMTAEGYAVWTEAVRSAIDKSKQEATASQ